MAPSLPIAPTASASLSCFDRRQVGACTASSRECISAYTVVALGDPHKATAVNLFKYMVTGADGVATSDVEVRSS